MNIDITVSLKQLWKTVFSDPDAFIDAFFQTAYSPDRCRYLTENGEIVSALYWFDCDCKHRKLAYLYAVATHPDHRGKGLASQLLADTHSYLKGLGYAGVVLKPAQGLFPFYERLGYATSSYIDRFEASAGKHAAALKELTPAEYGVLRRKMLPENAIVQEGVTLTFLATFAQFYTCAGALFCAVPEEAVLPEYLGDPSLIPGIIAALGLISATVTTPGSKLPFAMYHALDNTPMPGYLGISLE